jgi:hypothetical protein
VEQRDTLDIGNRVRRNRLCRHVKLSVDETQRICFRIVAMYKSSGEAIFPRLGESPFTLRRGRAITQTLW